MNDIRQKLNDVESAIERIRLYEHTHYDVKKALEKLAIVVGEILEEVELLKKQKS